MKIEESGISQIEFLKIAEAIHVRREYLTRQSITLTEGTSVADLENETIDTSKHLTVLLSRKFNTYQPADVFYIAGRDEAGALVSVCAGRRDWYSGWSIAKYLEEYLPRVLTGKDGEPAALRSVARALHTIKPTNAAYLCELWVSEKLRGNGLAPIMVQIAQLQALVRWQPDLIWALMADHDNWERGLAKFYGFTRQHRDVLRWAHEPVEIPASVWFVANDRESLCDMMTGSPHLDEPLQLRTKEA
ncbi:MAG: hypothetical protein JJ902_05225 [Roseibium sp.]|nr:hypothetical protein [Roseibium sp.]